MSMGCRLLRFRPSLPCGETVEGSLPDTQTFRPTVVCAISLCWQQWEDGWHHERGRGAWPTAVTDGPMVDLHDLVGRGLPAAAVGVGNVYGERRTKCLCVGNNVALTCAAHGAASLEGGRPALHRARKGAHLAGAASVLRALRRDGGRDALPPKRRPSATAGRVKARHHPKRATRTGHIGLRCIGCQAPAKRGWCLTLTCAAHGAASLEGGRPALHRARKGAHLAGAASVLRAFCGAMEGGTPSLQSGAHPLQPEGSK